MSPDSLTAHVAEFIATTRYEDISRAAVDCAKKAILDTIAVGLAGARSEGSAIVRRYVEELGCGSGPATVFGSVLRTQPRFAALANGAAMHADDFDDTYHPSRVHSSAPVLAAIFADAERSGASGRDLLRAFAVGTEVTCKISETIDRQHYLRGYHATSTCGVFGAGAGLCSLRGFSPQAARMTLGIAGSEAMGLRENFGTMMKPWHAGRAAESAVVAATLVGMGFTAAETILEGPRGFFLAGGGGFDIGRIYAKLGNPWCYVSPGVAVKPFPSGNIAHPAMCKLQEMVIAHDVRPDDVERIAVRTNKLVPLNLTFHRPVTGLEGKFSMEFCLAAIVVQRRAGLAEFTDAFVNRADVRGAIEKIDYTTYTDDEAATGGYQFLTAFLEIRMQDGRRFAARVDAANGSAALPMGEQQVAAKFRECAEFARWEAHRTEKLIELVLQLDRLDDIRELAALLRSAP